MAVSDRPGRRSRSGRPVVVPTIPVHARRLRRVEVVDGIQIDRNEIAAELQKQIDQLRQEAEEKLLSALTPQQQTRWRELMRRRAPPRQTDRE